MKVLVFGSTTDRQMLAQKTKKPTELDIVFSTTKLSPQASGVYSEFFIDTETMNLGVEVDGKRFFIGIEPGFEPVPKKLKPAKAFLEVDPENRFVMGTFKEDDSEDNDYLISLENEKAALVDHPKYAKCGVGHIDYASAWYVSESENQGSVEAPVDPPDIGKIASTVLGLAKNKQRCVEALGDFHGLTEHERQSFMHANFRTNIEATALVLYPSSQSQVATATQLLLRTPKRNANITEYSSVLGCAPGHVGMTHDDTTSTAILGKAGERAVSLRVFGNNAKGVLPLIVAGLEQCKHPTVLIDAVGLGLNVQNLHDLAEKSKKQFTVVIGRSKEMNDFADEVQDCGTNVEVIRNTVASACHARFKNSVPFCMVYSGSKLDEKPLFDSCEKSVANLLSPLFCPSLLYHQNWLSV